MTSLTITRPLDATIYATPRPGYAGAVAGAERLLTPDPKEGTKATGPTFQFVLDLGSIQLIDTAFVGYTDAPDGATVNVYVSNSTSTLTNVPFGNAVIDLGTSSDFQRHLLVNGAPIARRYVLFVVSNYGSALPTFGVAAAGLSFSTIWGAEQGAGRIIGDTGTQERLFGGGWSIDEGTTYTGYSWTFGDLQRSEADALYDMVRRVGQSKTVLVIEDAAQTSGLSTRIHWGIFQKLATYERLNPLDTRWEFAIGDWA